MVREILLTKNMMEGSHLYDIYLKVVGLVVIYLLAMYELIVQYIWLFRYRTGELNYIVGDTATVSCSGLETVFLPCD